MGDKACEMKVVEFEDYMHLADRIRQRFPHLTSVWLSSEMQEVIDKSKLYTNWDFYYTNVRRQVGNTTMAAYEASLGRPTSTNYPLVNFLMAAEADFFIGALGSTWCYLIDGMRNTGGKAMAGYLSVNKDRFW
ncbi:COATOMER PROTEIN [Salix purpurea]|uniref:COATOMER PROTEIN n=1 Tax=Salix purpurea TaxID=77065 RepID=A0A9Q0V9H4_SALPP|nr:COATOMER PROTEIN [Salix purpurea]